MEQKVSLEAKLALLKVSGTIPLLNRRGSAWAWEGFCACCGASSANGSAITIKKSLPDTIAIQEKSEAILIPDLAGNVLIEWENK